MVAKPLCPLYKNVIKPLDRARYPELRYLFYFHAATDGVENRAQNQAVTQAL